MEPALSMKRVLRQDEHLRRKWGSTLRFKSSLAESFYQGVVLRMSSVLVGVEEGRMVGWADDSWVSKEMGRVWAWVSRFDLKRESAAGCDPVERMTKAEKVSFCWIERERSKIFRKCLLSLLFWKSDQDRSQSSGCRRVWFDSCDIFLLVLVFISGVAVDDHLSFATVLMNQVPFSGKV